MASRTLKVERDTDELTADELDAYRSSSTDNNAQKKNSAFWSRAAIRILTDRQPQEAFLADDDDPF